MIATIAKSNNNFAIGFVTNSESRYLLKTKGQRDNIEAIKNLKIKDDIRLKDIAKVYFGHYENSAAFFGNGKEAIALSIQAQKQLML